MVRGTAKKRVNVESFDETGIEEQTPGSDSGGQSGDTQGLSGVAQADSQSVEELVEEGQFFEAAVINGIENAPPPDAGEIRTHQVRQDDVTGEYDDRESDVDAA